MSGSQASGQRNSTGSAETLPASPVAAPVEKVQKDEPPQAQDLAPRKSRKDFGFLPIPSQLQYDPEHPAHFGLAMNVTFGIASTFSEYHLLLLSKREAH